MQRKLKESTNNVIERLNWKICRRTRVVVALRTATALMLVCVQLRHVAGAQWDNKKYLNMNYVKVAVIMSLYGF